MSDSLEGHCENPPDTEIAEDDVDEEAITSNHGGGLGFVLAEPLKQQLKKDMEALLKSSTSLSEAMQPQLSTSLAIVPYVPPMERILKVMGDRNASSPDGSSSSSSRASAANDDSEPSSGSSSYVVKTGGRDSAYSTDSEDEDEMMNLLAVGVENMDCC